MHPMGMPCLNLNEALDFFAVVTTGFCPVMLTISCTAWSTTFAFGVASPSPIFKTIFSSRGTCMTFLYLNSFIMLGTIFLLYTPFNRTIISPKPPRIFYRVLPSYHPQGLFVPLELAPYIYLRAALHWI